MLSSRQPPALIFVHPAAAGRKQRGMPAEQAFFGQGLGILLGGVEHHLNDAFDVPVGGGKCPDIEPEAAGDRGAHLVAVEDFAFDLAGFEHSSVSVSRTASSLSRKPRPSIRPIEPSLPVTHSREGGRKPPVDPTGTPATR